MKEKNFNHPPQNMTRVKNKAEIPKRGCLCSSAMILGYMLFIYSFNLLCIRKHMQLYYNPQFHGIVTQGEAERREMI